MRRQRGLPWLCIGLFSPIDPAEGFNPEWRCADFGEVIAKIRKFRTTNTDPKRRIRVYVPAHAPDRERREIEKLGIEVM